MSTPTVPARGEQQALVTLDAPAMVHLTASSGSGTACTVVDQVRGPFAASGSAGKANCALDLLLDQGTYKVRLSSPARGKGVVKVQASAFADLHPRPLRLSPRQRFTGKLSPGQQASFWLSVGPRQVPYLRVSGRTAGEVRLWRNGEWLEEAPLRRTTAWPTRSKAVHEWWLDRPLDEGDYLVTVYGTNAMRWAGGGESDTVEVERGFRQGSVDRHLDFTVPESGVVAVEVPPQPVAALLTLKAGPAQPVELHAFGFGANGPLESPEGRCRLEPKTLVPECAAQAPGNGGHVLMVRGAPGTRGVVEWAQWGLGGGWRGGYYGAATRQLPLATARSGTHLVGLHDLPADTDAAPLGCQLEELVHGAPPLVLARDVTRLDDGQMLDRQFNYDGASALVWLEIAKAERYRITTKGERKSRCEVFRFEGRAGELKRLTESRPGARDCNEALVLTPGVYQVSLYEGLPGVERLVVREDNQRALKAVPHKASCLLPEVPLSAHSDYRLVTNRVGAIAARGVVVEPLPLTLGRPLHLVLDGGAKLTLPVPNGRVLVRGQGLSCGPREPAPGKDGECVAEVNAGRLALYNPGAAPVATTVFTPAQATPEPVLEAWAPAAKPLLRVPLDAPSFFDFGREQSHSMIFDVDQPGLYHVTTQGLLSTQCRLRTPVVTAVAQDTRGGRGRNCLVAGYLRPGRYMLTVGTVGQSRGRAAVLMSRRAPKVLAGVAADGEAFFRVESGDLVQQKLTVKRRGRYALSSTAQGVGVQCRLDDAQGWPVEPVPSPCVGTRWLKAGSYLWTQLPLTLDSMRRTALARERPPTLLKGSRPHPVDLFTWYRAELGKDGKDAFTFELAGPVQLDVVLTDGMQGRLEVLEADKPPRAVEVIPPRLEARPRQEQAPEDEGEGESMEQTEGEGESEGESDGDEAQTERLRRESEQRARARALEATAAPAGPEGVQVPLPAGKYRLVTQHSRGDVGVTYRLHLSADALMPGMARTVPVPTRLPVIVPQDGTLRLRTVGEADVRCRLLRPDGTLLFESSENGADWNCAAAEPVPAGRYTLLLESETLARGETRVALALATTEDQPPLSDGATFALGSGVQRVGLPAAEQDAVHELSFAAKSPFSCALEDPDGQVRWQRSRVTTCAVLLRPKAQAWKARLWTTDGAAKVTAALRTRKVVGFERGQVPAGQAALVRLPAAGRFSTSAQVFCLPESETGPLRPCGPEASLGRGGHVLSGLGPTPTALPLESLVKSVAAAASTSREYLRRTPLYEALGAKGPALFLLSAQVSYGERASPECGFEGAGTVRELRDAACFAASAVGEGAVARVDAWTRDEAPVPADVQRRAVAVPSSPVALAPGRQTVGWQGEAGLFSFPAGQHSRVELVLPGGAWAVLLSPQGQAVDLCAPGEDLRRCVFSASGHRLLLSGPEARATATVLKLEAPVRQVRFTGLYEEAPSAEGALVLDVPAATAERVLLVEGASRCRAVLADGRRMAGCRASLPADVAARLELEHGGAPFRVVAFAPGADKAARLADAQAAPVPAPKLEQASVAPLAGARLERTLVLAKDAVVRLRSDAGVCGLWRGGELLSVDGLGRGCALTRLLGPGTYRAVVRPFAGQPLAGGLHWTAEPVVALSDGVGREEWIAPGEMRLFRFATQAPGKVGVGLQVKAEQLECTVYDDGQQVLGEGCQQYLALGQGSFLLAVRHPPKVGAAPLRFGPVVLGLAGTREEVPEDYLRELFGRIGGAQ